MSGLFSELTGQTGQSNEEDSARELGQSKLYESVPPSAWNGYWSTYESMRESRQTNFDEYSKQLQILEKELFGEELPTPPTNLPPPIPTEDEPKTPLIASSIWDATSPPSRQQLRKSTIIPQHLSVSINARKAQLYNNMQSSMLLYPEASASDSWVPPPDLMNTMLFSVPPGLSEDWMLLGEEPTPGIFTLQNTNLHSSETKEEKEALRMFTPLLEKADVGLIANRALTIGIPNELRAEIWQLLLGYLPSNKPSRSHVLKFQRRTYLRLVERYYGSLPAFPPDDDTEDANLMHIITVDVDRTHPSMIATCLVLTVEATFMNLFYHQSIKEALKRILFLWSKENSHISYFQGLNDLATPFLVVFLVSRFGGLTDYNNEYVSNSNFKAHLMTYLPSIEADSYWCLSKMMNDLQTTLTFTEGGIHAEEMMTKFRELMRRINPDLVAHLEAVGIDFIMFSFRWMLCFLSRELSIKNLIILWDNYISQGTSGFAVFHLYVCAAFLQELAPLLMKEGSDLGDCMYFLQHPPSTLWEPANMEALINEARRLWALYP